MIEIVVLLALALQEKAPQEKVSPEKTPQEKEWGKRDWDGKAVARLREKKDYMVLDEKKNLVAVYVSVEAICPVCEWKSPVAHNGKQKRVVERDLDLKIPKYIEGNPYLFQYWMCPKCNYCRDQKEFESPVDIPAMKTAIGKTKQYDSYFDIPYSDLLKRAEQCAIARKASAEELADLLLYGAWVARDCGETEAEKECQRRAREKFEAAYETGDWTRRPRSAYLAGEISRRLGDREKAEDWLKKAYDQAKENGRKDVQDWVEACREQMKKDGQK